mmetsp:Transcript_13429/g.54213  ORF Transcript_13429/g.54213 Transcript_13429/m.54213 type:complete len:245 (-) Transcript_13429:1455-2189(-)
MCCLQISFCSLVSFSTMGRLDPLPDPGASAGADDFAFVAPGNSVIGLLPPIFGLSFSIFAPISAFASLPASNIPCFIDFALILYCLSLIFFRSFRAAFCSTFGISLHRLSISSNHRSSQAYLAIRSSSVSFRLPAKSSGGSGAVGSICFLACFTTGAVGSIRFLACFTTFSFCDSSSFWNKEGYASRTFQGHAVSVSSSSGIINFFFSSSSSFGSLAKMSSMDKCFRIACFLSCNCAPCVAFFP